MTRAAVLRRAVIAALLLAWCIPLLVPASALAADPVTVEFPLGGGSSGPEGIVTGPDHNLWIAQEQSNQIARMTRDGVVQQFSVPPTGAIGAGPLDITVGYDGRLWFAEYGDIAGGPGVLGRIDTNGNFAPIPLGRPMRLWGVTRGPDGNMWFTEFDQAKIGRIAPSGDLHTLAEFPTLTGNSFPSEIIAGPDGNLWFSEEGAGKIGRITPTGAVSEWDIPNQPTTGAGPCGITVGRDGKIWFAEQDANRIGRLDPATGIITQWDIPGAGPVEMITGPDGNVWFAEGLTNKVGRIDVFGNITEYAAPTTGASPYGLTMGPDGNLWFTEQQVGSVGRVNLAVVYPNHAYLPLVRR